MHTCICLQVWQQKMGHYKSSSGHIQRQAVTQPAWGMSGCNVTPKPPLSYLFLFCADVKIVGLGAQDKVAVIQSCPTFPGPPGPKGDRGSPAQKGRDLDRGDCPVTSPLVSPPPVPPRGWDPV